LVFEEEGGGTREFRFRRRTGRHVRIGNERRQRRQSKFEEFTVEKDVDQASAPLFQACTAGAHYPDVVLIVRKPGGSNLLYVQFIFRQVFVTGVNWSGGGGEENPKESIKFKFGAMGIQYVQQTAKGGEGTKMQGWWSTNANQPDSTVSGLSGPPEFLNASQS
jgi:type VI protein secretion system component Hcp